MFLNTKWICTGFFGGTTLAAILTDQDISTIGALASMFGIAVITLYRGMRQTRREEDAKDREELRKWKRSLSTAKGSRQRKPKQKPEDSASE